LTNEEENAIIVAIMAKRRGDTHVLVGLACQIACPEEDLEILQVVLWGNPETGEHPFRLNWQSDRGVGKVEV
jgi:hypothetical protein